MKHKQLASLGVSLVLASTQVTAGEGDPIYSPEMPAGAEISYYSIDRNAFSGRLTVTGGSAGGAIEMVVDRTSDSIHLSLNGRTASYTIDEFSVMYAGGDRAQASAIASTLRGNLSIGRGIAGVAFAGQSWIDDGGSVGNVGGPDFGGACDLSPCRPNWSNDYGTRYDLTYVPVDKEIPNWEDAYSEDVIAYDRARFEKEREEHCENMGSKTAKIGIGAVGSIAACGIASGGWGTLACIAAIGGTLLEASSQDDVELCGTEYPGPGNW